jgi:hypothetical protein
MSSRPSVVISDRRRQTRTASAWAYDGYSSAGAGRRARMEDGRVVPIGFRHPPLSRVTSLRERHEQGSGRDASVEN